jgi:CubicO group peptidase (beta-lactamase class C family)
MEGFTMSRCLAQLAGIALLLPSTTPAAPAPQIDRGRLDAFVRQAMTVDVAPGLAIAVVDGQHKPYARGFGYADRERNRRVTPKTRFYIASTTKSFTALAAVLMHHRGSVDLDAPLSRSLPEARLKPPLSADAITLRDLLAHTHGISQDMPDPIVLRTAFTGEFTNAQLLDLLADYPPARNGRAFHYGNLGYVIAGLALERADGHGWKDIVERDVLRPAGMKNTSAWRSRTPDKRTARPYVVAATGVRRLALEKADNTMHAAGGHFSTVLDLARYLEAHLNAGRLRGKQVYPPAVLAETRRLHADQDREYGDIHRFGWGLGWDLGRLDGEVLVHRFGGFPGYHCHLSFMPERGVGLAVLANESDGGSRLASLVAGFAYELWLGRPDLEARYAQKLEALRQQVGQYRAKLAADGSRRAGAAAASLPRPPDAYAGKYENRKFGLLELQAVDGTLVAKLGALSSPVAATPDGKLGVDLMGSGSVIEVRFPADGTVADRLVFQGEEFIRITH